MPGPKLQKNPNLVLADKVIEALWQLLKKRGRTKELLYRAAAFEAHEQKNAQGYLIQHHQGRPPWAVLVVAITGDSGVYLLAADRAKFEGGSSRPQGQLWEQRIGVIATPHMTARVRNRQFAQAAQLVFTALQFGKFDPDIVQRIGSLAYS